MMVTALGRLRFMAQRFEARRLAGKVDPHDLPSVVQRLELAVHGRQVQARYSRLGPRQDFRRTERVAAVRQGINQGLALAGVTFHKGMLMQIDSQ